MQWAILSAAGLLLVGYVLRATVRPLRAMFIPASVVGGLVGLVVLQILERGARPAVAETATTLALELRSWPGPLIAVVFAGLLLERPEGRFRESARGAALAGVMVWIIVLGEIVVGLSATWLLIGRTHDVPAAFGQLIEAGFAGGHATAAALGIVYVEQLDFPAGLDLGLFMATVGLVYGVVSGIVLVNVAVRRGWTRGGRAETSVPRGPQDRSEPRPIAFARVRAEIIDPLAFQVVLLAMAVALGVAIKAGFTGVVDLVDRAVDLGDVARYAGRLPLFLFTLLGGLGVRKILETLGLGRLIDGASTKRLVGVAMEFLIVAAVASLRLEAVRVYAGPLALLIVLGAGWTVFCLVVLARRLLPAEHWFELGILNYGMSTATTAQGLMLLRIVDPDLESGAAEHYALAAPLSAPFIGGGVITLTLPLVLAAAGTPLVIGVAVALMVALYALGRRLNRTRVETPPATRRTHP